MSNRGAAAARVRWFPVRHHSPAAARLVRAMIAEERPDCVLIEGPADFNDRIDELALDHRPPIAVYSSVIVEDSGKAAAYHPLCLHSPEWQALRAGFACDAVVRFIDLPWAAVASETATAHRYGDEELQRSPTLSLLCERLGVEDLDAAWDLMFEIEPELELDDYLRRCEAICSELRGADEAAVPDRDRRREAFMATRIRAALEEHAGVVAVVCGGFHLSALRRLVASEEAPVAEEPAPPRSGDGRVVTLTPYSFEALDSLTGYEAGMPNPGFYDLVWRARSEDHHGEPPSRVALGRIVARLRERGQHISPADMIAVETTAGGLAALRGHAEVWRFDLLDGILAAVVKDELELGVPHPVLDAAHEVLRGGLRGRLAPGVSRPPFVEDLERALKESGLMPQGAPRAVDLALAGAGDAPADLARSRLLHRVAVLAIPGFEPVQVIARPQSDELRERWRVRRDPAFDGAAIEASGYGTTVAEAAAGRLLERLAETADAGTAASVLVDAALCGLDRIADPLLDRMGELVAADPDIAAVAAALSTALHLYRYEPVLGTAGERSYGALVAACFDRALWLLDPGGGVQPEEDAGAGALEAVVECWERCGSALDMGRAELVDVLDRILGDDAAAAGLRGTALGALWTLEVADDDDVVAAPARFADPDDLGDFLYGLFRLAREPVTRRPDFIARIDAILMGFDESEFLDALPALRRAFRAFSPREKDRLASAIGDAGLGVRGATEPETVIAVVALEERLRDALHRYGIRWSGR